MLKSMLFWSVVLVGVGMFIPLFCDEDSPFALELQNHNCPRPAYRSMDLGVGEASLKR